MLPPSSSCRPALGPCGAVAANPPTTNSSILQEEPLMARSMATCCLAMEVALACLCVLAADAPNRINQEESRLAVERSIRFYPGFSGYARRVTCASAEAQRWFDQRLVAAGAPTVAAEAGQGWRGRGSGRQSPASLGAGGRFPSGQLLLPLGSTPASGRQPSRCRCGSLNLVRKRCQALESPFGQQTPIQLLDDDWDASVVDLKNRVRRASAHHTGGQWSHDDVTFMGLEIV